MIKRKKTVLAWEMNSMFTISARGLLTAGGTYSKNLDGLFLFRVGRCIVTHSEPEPCISLAPAVVFSVCFVAVFLSAAFVPVAGFAVSTESNVPACPCPQLSNLTGSTIRCTVLLHIRYENECYSFSNN